MGKAAGRPEWRSVWNKTPTVPGRTATGGEGKDTGLSRGVSPMGSGARTPDIPRAYLDPLLSLGEGQLRLGGLGRRLNLSQLQPRTGHLQGPGAPRLRRGRSQAPSRQPGVSRGRSEGAPEAAARLSLPLPACPCSQPAGREPGAAALRSPAGCSSPAVTSLRRCPVRPPALPARSSLACRPARPSGGAKLRCAVLSCQLKIKQTGEAALPSAHANARAAASPPRASHRGRRCDRGREGGGLGHPAWGTGTVMPRRSLLGEEPLPPPRSSRGGGTRWQGTPCCGGSQSPTLSSRRAPSRARGIAVCGCCLPHLINRCSREWPSPGGKERCRRAVPQLGRGPGVGSGSGARQVPLAALRNSSSGCEGPHWPCGKS